MKFLEFLADISSISVLIALIASLSGGAGWVVGVGGGYLVSNVCLNSSIVFVSRVLCWSILRLWPTIFEYFRSRVSNFSVKSSIAVVMVASWASCSGATCLEK